MTFNSQLITGKTAKDLHHPAHSWLVIPKGTSVSNKAAEGFLPPGQFFVKDLSWIDRNKYGIIYHDAYYYGIRVDSENVEIDR